METIRFQCPECHSQLRVAPKYAGQRKRCPHPECGQLILVPEVSASPPAVSAPAAPAQTSPKNTAPQEPKVVKAAAKATKAVSVSSQKPASNPRKTDRQTGATSGSSRSSSKSTAKSVKAKASKTGAARGKRPFRLLSWSGLVVLGLLVAIGLGFSFGLPSGNTGDVSPLAVAVQAKAPDVKESYAQKVQPFFQKYCYDCHGADIQEGGIQLDLFEGNPAFLDNYLIWAKIHQQIAVGSMPPQDYDSPTTEERTAVAEWLDQQIYHFDCNQVNNPGRVTVHRLNRNEYDNTLRDLLGVDLNLSKNFPTDDVGYGFDNIGDVLSVSPLLMERYLDAAEKAAEAVITLPETMVVDREWNPGDFQIVGSGSVQGRDLAFVSAGRGAVKFDVKVPGKYRFQVRASATQAGTELSKFQVKINDQEIGIHEVPGHRVSKNFEWTTELTAGPKELSLAFINDHYAPDAEDPKMRDRNMYFQRASIKSLQNVELKHYPEAHRRFVTHTPSAELSPEESARKIFAAFLPKAYRRPVTITEMDRILKVFQIAQERQESYERSLQIALQAVLVSPQFLFRLEELPDSAVAQEIQQLGDYELASRLSYFLWSSMPDEELLKLAAKGKLHQPEVLEQQTRRMLKDPKAIAFTRNFVGQWLGLRKLGENKPDTDLFPVFTQELVDAMPRETEMLFADILREDRSLMEFLTADYTFLNETLANLYGIEGVQGKEFRKVSLQDMPRRGFISHAGILTLTSFPNRTSPVKRGEWVLENVLAQAPPPAPASVPGLEETQQANPNLTFREQLALHLSDPVCKTCHLLMDGIGFGLENFDAIGRWRTHEGEHKLDTRGDLPDGSSFEGPLQLIQILGRRPDDFTRCISEKMLTYALGRGLEWYDKCTIDDIIASTRADDYRLTRVVVEVVLSPAFRNQKLAD